MTTIVRSHPRLAARRATKPSRTCYPLDVVYAQAGLAAPRALSTFHDGASYFRRVLLVHERSARPVEMGAIRIDLDAFAPRIRAAILRNRVPLGRVLRDGGVDYRSRPSAFLSVTPNSEMMGVFWMREPRTLYGRRTEMSVGGRKIGDIVEVLPRV